MLASLPNHLPVERGMIGKRCICFIFVFAIFLVKFLGSLVPEPAEPINLFMTSNYSFKFSSMFFVQRKASLLSIIVVVFCRWTRRIRILFFRLWFCSLFPSATRLWFFCLPRLCFARPRRCLFPFLSNFLRCPCRFLLSLCTRFCLYPISILCRLSLRLGFCCCVLSLFLLLFLFWSNRGGSFCAGFCFFLCCIFFLLFAFRFGFR
mmetsp:Transcript_25225/g.69671  ORF Transcript_25225/g.69671 Transcript_25225/m.69671 type:complete len:206 (+) Transcript_25225:2820-3437(+)